MLLLSCPRPELSLACLSSASHAWPLYPSLCPSGPSPSSVLPSIPSFSKAGIRVRVDLQHVSYKVRRRASLPQLLARQGPKEQVILQDVNLTFHPGTLVAVMGPSGVCGSRACRNA